MRFPTLSRGRRQAWLKPETDCIERTIRALKYVEGSDRVLDALNKLRRNIDSYVMTSWHFAALDNVIETDKELRHAFSGLIKVASNGNVVDSFGNHIDLDSIVKQYSICEENLEKKLEEARTK